MVEKAKVQLPVFLSKREYYAALAMQALLSRTPAMSFGEAASEAVLAAEKLCEALKK